MRQAVIVAGGAGTRLASVAGPLPKALVPIGGRPVIEWQLDELERAGVEEVLVLSGVGHEALARHLAGRARPSISFVREDAPLGTAGALVAARARLDASFLVLFGDVMLAMDLGALARAHAASGALLTVAAHPNDHPSDSDLLELDPEGALVAVHRAPHAEGALLPNLACAAVYAVSREALDHAPRGRADLSRDLLPRLVGRARAYRTREYLKDMGTPERLARVDADQRAGRIAARRADRLLPAVFFDRDGTLTREVGHVRSPEALELLPGAAEAVRAVNAAGRLAVLVTNQPVLARGELDEAGLARVHHKLERELGRAGAYLDAIYFCPHHPDRGFAGERPELKRACECRKPAPGMLLRAARELGVELPASWIIGDSERDVEAGRAAGVRALRVGEGLTIGAAVAHALAEGEA